MYDLPMRLEPEAAPEFALELGTEAALALGFGGEIVPVVISELAPYTGAYTVTPKPAAQRLATRQKRMTDDVTVQAIPYYEVSNESGTTVTRGA